MTTILQPVPPPSQIRSELLDEVVLDLLGPAHGPDEELDERNVRDRYLVGMLAPKRQELSPEEFDELAQGGVGSSEDGSTDFTAPPAKTMFPSSFGMTFCVDAEAEAIQITARWGQYLREHSETLTKESGDAKLVWKRQAREGTSKPMPLQAGRFNWKPQPDLPEGYVQAYRGRRASARLWRATWAPVTLYRAFHHSGAIRVHGETHAVSISRRPPKSFKEYAMKSSRRLLCLLFLIALLVVHNPPPAGAAERPQAMFMRGFNAVSLIDPEQAGSQEFKSQVTAALPNHAVSYWPLGHDRERVIIAIRRADIFYLSGHSGPVYQEMQSLLVRPSKENKNRSPKGNSLITAGEIAEALEGREGPRLVIINGCDLANPDDKVSEDKRISTAFGITAKTSGRAFIGWPFEVVGKVQDKSFAEFLSKWTEKQANGEYPTLEEALSKVKWTTKPPTILGDRKLRYRGLLGLDFEKPAPRR